MIAQYKAELVALSEGEPTKDKVSELLGEDPLTPYRRELGVAIANFALVSSRSETEKLDEHRMRGHRGLTVQTIDTVLNIARPAWIHAMQAPASAARRIGRERPVAGTTTTPTQSRRPSLGNLPGSGFKF
jgi:hypothetical protein